jgi:hypothetical protein
MTPECTTQLATELLLSGLVSLLAIVMLATVLALIFVRRKHAPERRARAKSEVIVPPSRGYQPSIFEHSCRWIAVKKNQVKTVQLALDLHNPVPCSWDEGTSRLADRKLFISPPVRGWILVIGQGLPDPSEDVDRCFHFITRLSRALGHVQFFNTHRALNHHAWVRAEGGRIRRAYAWAGETLWNQGPLTQAEHDLGLKCFDYGERPAVIDVSPNEPQPSNAEKVMQLAARWSLDPSTVEERMLHMGLGVAGELTHSRRR